FDDDSVAVAATGDGCKAVPLPEATPWTEAEQLAFEKETLGLYWSGHPVDRYAAALREFGAKSVADLSETQAAVRDRSWGPAGPKPIEPDTSIGGIVAAVRPLKTKKGDRMAVFTLEDAQGSVEIIAFPEAYQRAAGMIEPGTLVLVRGKLERDDETSRILASEIAPIESVREKLAREVAIHLRMPAETLEFEEPIAVLLKEIDALTLLPRTDARDREIESLRRRIESVREELYRSLTPWQRVLVSRHPNRPGLHDYLDRLFQGFTE